MKIEESFFKQ